MDSTDTSLATPEAPSTSSIDQRAASSDVSSPIPEGPEPTGYKLPAKTVQDWMSSGRATPQQIHSAAMAVDSSYKQGVDRLNTYAKANNQPNGDDPNFISRALYTYYKAGDKPVSNPTTTSLLQALHEQNRPKPTEVPKTPTVTNPPQPPWWQGIADTANAAGSDISSAFSNASATAGRSDLNPVGKVLGTAGDLTLGAADALSEPIKPVVKSVEDLLNAGSKANGPSVTAPKAPAISKDDINNVQSAIDHFSTQNPNIAASLKGLLGIGTLALGAQGAQDVVEGVGGAVENLGKGAEDFATNTRGVGGVAPTQDEFNSQIDELKNAKNEEALQKSVMPPTTAREMQNAKPELRNEGTFFENPSLSPTTGQKEMAKVAGTIEGYNPSSSPIQNAKAVQQAWNNESESLRTSMSANERLQGVKVSDEELLNAVKSGIDKAGLDPESGPGKKIINLWQDSVDGASNGKPTGAWQSKIDFSKDAIKKWGGSIYDKGSELADGVNETHSAVNDLIKSKTAGMGVDYAGQMDRLTNMHGILENLSSQLKGGALKSTFSKIIKSPVVRTTAAVVGGEELLRRGGHIIP